jgi:hypothetical protein
VEAAVRGCWVTERCAHALCVNGSDTLLLNTVVTCGEYSSVGAENCWQVCVLVISRPGADSLFTVESKSSTMSCLHNED